MRKNFKRTLAVLCAAALTTLSVAVAGNLSSLKTAAEVSPSGEINFGKDNAYLKLNDALESAPTSVEAEVNMPSTIKDEWVLYNCDGKSDFIGGMKVSNGLVTVGTTNKNEAPGEGMKYLEFTSESKTLTTYTNNLGIDVSRYNISISENKSDLTLAFWAYSETDGSLFNGGELRLSSKSSGEDDRPHAYYSANQITVKAGWNYIEIPLHKFKFRNGYSFTNGINTFRIHGCKVTDSANYRMERIGEVKLVVNKNASEWTLINGNEEYKNGINDNNTFTYSHVTIENDTVTEEQPNSAEIAGSDYIKVATTSNATFSIVKNLSPSVDLSKYSPEDLELDFWFYTSKGGTVFDGGWLFFSNSKDGFTGQNSGAAKGIPAASISKTLDVGWNHIKIPLNKMTEDADQNNKVFSYSDIKCFKFNGVKTSEACVSGIGKVKIVAKTEDKVYASTVDETVYNKGYSILSNLNSGTGDTPYALFVTREGKPAFIYNDKMFVLNHNICTGEFVKLGVTVNKDGTVTFNVGDNITATSVDTVDTSAEVQFTAPHSIGADANGGTLMNGSIKNLVVKNGETETGRWELFANKAYPLNAVKDSVGSNHAHFAGIADSNAAVVVEYSNATAGAAPADTDDMDGYVFAGWFTDADCTKAFTGTNAKAYAKYVDKAVLTVKAQVNSDKNAIRFVTTVDSLDYKLVGFDIEFCGKKADPEKTKTTTVYTSLNQYVNDNKEAVLPTVFSPVSKYFAAFTVRNVPIDKTNEKFTVKAYWITLDGTTVYGESAQKSIS